MTLWEWIILASVTAFLIKLSGYLLPRSFLDSPPVNELATAVTVGLLASLTVSNAVGDGQSLLWDSRLLAVGAAAVALYLRVPFIFVVLIGAVAAASGRLFGLP